MATKSRHILFALALTVLLSACAGGGSRGTLPTRNFPEVQIPSILPQEEIADYVLDHFWDAYLDTTGHWFCDSTHIGGVNDRILATQMASFLSILENSSREKAGAVMSEFFDKVERYQAADTASNVFSWMSDAVEYYLFDPNSEIRSEELFLPFISKLAVSPFAKEDLRTRYVHAAQVCATHRIGTPASDFRFLDAKGRSHTLYGEKAPFTVLLFVNPGCNACEEVVASFESERMKELVRTGKVKIIGIYIDDDIDEWMALSDRLPAHWINGYDPAGIIRGENLYFVRAIPSIYLLDAEKRILMKDAVPESVAVYVEHVWID